MLFDFSNLDAPSRYKLLVSTVFPRPIAWVVTLDPAGRRNAAPFSFFNVFGEDPAVIAIGIGGRRPGPYKDSAANIRANREFVVNLVPEALLQPMHVTAIDFDTGDDELVQAGLSVAPSHHVAPPRIAESPVALECRLHSIVEFGTPQSLVIGEVLAMHIADDAILDPARCHVDSARLGLIGRVYGPGGYIRATGPGIFNEARLRRQDWTRVQDPTESV